MQKKLGSKNIILHQKFKQLKKSPNILFHSTVSHRIRHKL